MKTRTPWLLCAALVIVSAAAPALGRDEVLRRLTAISKSWGTAYAFTGVDPLDWGQVYKYRFDVSEMKDPVIAVTTGAGWSYVPVTTRGGLRG